MDAAGAVSAGAGSGVVPLGAGAGAGSAISGAAAVPASSSGAVQPAASRTPNTIVVSWMLEERMGVLRRSCRAMPGACPACVRDPARGLSPGRDVARQALSDLDRAAHHRPVAREAAEELVRAAALDRTDREGDGRGTTASDQFGMGDDACVVGRHIVAIHARAHAGGG